MWLFSIIIWIRYSTRHPPFLLPQQRSSSSQRGRGGWIPWQRQRTTKKKNEDDDVVLLNRVDKIKFPRTDYGWIPKHQHREAWFWTGLHIFNIWVGCFVGRFLTAFGGLSFGSEADNDNNINDGGRIENCTRTSTPKASKLSWDRILIIHQRVQRVVDLGWTLSLCFLVVN